mmetsp:Transcript_3026/g.5456  ORF Transcript_3026/g.5456 Transcript_3026/m.5456 type:complete len:92 (-) Transcript_3026:1742-2017(-)
MAEGPWQRVCTRGQGLPRCDISGCDYLNRKPPEAARSPAFPALRPAVSPHFISGADIVGLILSDLSGFSLALPEALSVLLGCLSKLSGGAL